MDNAAFEPNWNEEAARILRDAAKKIEQGQDGFGLRDINGNKVGQLGVYD